MSPSWIFIKFIAYFVYVQYSETSPTVNIVIDAGKPYKKVIPHFWSSTGLCPPAPHELATEFFLSKDMKFNLALMGALSSNDVIQVRIHWLLQLVKLSFKRDTIHFNFTHLDNLLDWIKSSGLKPGFEMMGNPSNYFRNFENKTQLQIWRQLVAQLATRYIDRYGLNYVKNWNFESWNEPDNHDFDNLTITTRGLLNYYDATSEGLKQAHPALKLGAPAQRLRIGRSPLAWALLQHCYNGTNLFTNETGVRIDFFSTHVKGNGSSIAILQNELATFDQINRLFPNFTNLPFYNDEADPMVGWIHALPWRGDATYAAIIVKVISQHWHLRLRSHNPLPSYTLLSNDNAFLSYQPRVFEQRTLTARFQINNTSPPYVILVRKPVYAAMKLLDYLYSTPVPVLVTVNGRRVLINESNVAAIASIDRNNWSLSALFYFSEDVKNSSDTANIKLCFKDLQPIKDQTGNLTLMWYEIDNRARTNPFLIWQRLEEPSTPTRSQFQRIMAAEEPRRGGPFILKESFYSEKIKLRSPSIRLFHFCNLSSPFPRAVSNVQVHNVTSNLVLITWQDQSVGTKCINTFEIELSTRSPFGPYYRINGKNTIFTTFYFIPVINSEWHHSSDDLVRGYYRIRVVDYWNRTSPYSAVYKYGLN